MSRPSRSIAKATTAGVLALFVALHGGDAGAQTRGSHGGLFGRLFGARPAAPLVRRPAPARPAPIVARTQRPVANPAPVRWATTEHPTATLIYMHGLGGTPGDGLSREIFNGLRASGAKVAMVSPFLRDAVEDETGRVRSVGPHMMSAQLERVSALIERTPGPIVLVGHSFGGKAALALAQRHPDRVRGVVALAPSVRMLHAYWKRVSGASALPGDRDALMRGMASERADLVSALDHAETRGEARAVRSALEYHDVMTDLALQGEERIDRGSRVPTTVIHGTEDRAVSIHYARRFAAENPGVRLVEMPGLDHGFQAGLGEPEAKALEHDGMQRIVRETQRMIAGATR